MNKGYIKQAKKTVLISNATEIDEPSDPTPTEDYQYVNIGLPPDVVSQLREKARNDKSSMRYEILRALRRVGYDIPRAELVKDGRRGRFTRQRVTE